MSAGLTNVFFLYRVIIMLKLRLKRVGRRHDPSFRVVITENTAPPKGKYLEAVGFYNARLKQIKLDAERIRHWLSVGAQPTDTVHNLLIKEGIMKGKKIAVHSTRQRKKSDEAASTPTEGGDTASTESVKAEDGDGAEKKEETDETLKDDKKDTAADEAASKGSEEISTDSTQDAPQTPEEEKKPAKTEETTPTKSDENDKKDEKDVEKSALAEENKEENQDKG